MIRNRMISRIVPCMMQRIYDKESENPYEFL